MAKKAKKKDLLKKLGVGTPAERAVMEYRVADGVKLHDSDGAVYLIFDHDHGHCVVMDNDLKITGFHPHDTMVAELSQKEIVAYLAGLSAESLEALKEITTDSKMLMEVNKYTADPTAYMNAA